MSRSMPEDPYKGKNESIQLLTQNCTAHLSTYRETLGNADDRSIRKASKISSFGDASARKMVGRAYQPQPKATTNIQICSRASHGVSSVTWIVSAI